MGIFMGELLVSGRVSRLLFNNALEKYRQETAIASFFIAGQHFLR